jgi:NADH dehydrogenase
LRHEFRAIDPAKASVLLLDAAKRVLPGYPEDLSRKCARSLERLGVTLRLGAMVDSVTPDGVAARIDGHDDRIAARTVLWAAGVRASPMGRRLAKAIGAETDKGGRIPVEPDLTVPDHPEIFVIGDLSRRPDAQGRPLPGIAPVAMQQGRYVARVVRARLARPPCSPSTTSTRGSWRPSAGPRRSRTSAGCASRDIPRGCCGSSFT